MKTTRRLFLNFLMFAPVLNLLNALRKMFAPPADVVSADEVQRWQSIADKLEQSHLERRRRLLARLQKLGHIQLNTTGGYSLPEPAVSEFAAIVNGRQKS